MFLLDTVSLSELNRVEPDAGLAAWVAGQHAADLFISVLTIGEIEHGIQLLPLSRRRVQLPEVDALIAATANLRGFTVVTRNVRDFERSGVAILNPWAPNPAGA